MSEIIFVNKNIPEYDLFISCVKVSIYDDLNIENINQNITRIGFVWENNRSIMPFGSTSSNTHYFTQEFVNYLLKYTQNITVDLITCEIGESPVFQHDLQQLKNQLPNVTFNYSVNLTGNTQQGDWIMESSGENIKNIYFNDNINNYNHVFALPTSGTLGGNFIYNDASGIRTFTLTTDFITNTWTQKDITYSNNVNQVVVDGNNHTITINQNNFTGLFFAGNEYLNNTKPTIIKNFIIKSSVNILGALLKLTGHVNIDNCYLELVGNINNNGGGLVYNDDGTTNNINLEVTNSAVKVFGKIGSNAGPLIGYISYNSDSVYTINNCHTVISDSDTDLLNPLTLASSAGAFVGSGISNNATITNSYCLFNGSVAYGTGIIAGKFLGSNGTLTINKFYAVTNITYVTGYTNPSDISQYSYNMSSYHGGSAPNSINISNVNILHLNLNLSYIYGAAGTLYDSVGGFNKYTTYLNFITTAHHNNAKIGANTYEITYNSYPRTFYTFETTNINNWNLDFDNSKLRIVSELSSFSIDNRSFSSISFTPTLPTVIIGDGDVTYSSSNTLVATVNEETGEITMVKPGKVTITATISTTDKYYQTFVNTDFVIINTSGISAARYLVFLEKLKEILNN